MDSGGPYPAGAWPNINIFTSCLALFLEPGEHVEANDSYGGHVDNVKCPKINANPIKNHKMQGHVWVHRHEVLNRRWKNLGDNLLAYRSSTKISSPMGMFFGHVR